MEGYHPAVEEYTEAIYELREDSVKGIQARLAERLDVSRPAVSEMIRRLQTDGLVHIEKGRIHLTPEGEHIAERTVRRHRLAERFLTDILGLSWAQAHVEAGQWEHVISDDVEQAMLVKLGHPTTCPHGNPIPGSEYIAPDTVVLADLPSESGFVVSRIPEELEFTRGMLEFLEENSLTPGNSGRFVATSPEGTTTVEVGGRTVGIGPFASHRILVTT